MNFGTKACSTSSTLRLFVVVSLILGAGSCGKKKKKVSGGLALKLSLVKGVESTLTDNPTLLKNELNANLVDQDEDFANGKTESEFAKLIPTFVPESYLVPIVSINAQESLSGFSGSTVYSCAAGTAAGCMVDIADKAAVDALLLNYTATLSGNVEDGGDVFATIAAFSVSYCGLSESSSTRKIKGKVVFKGTTWYTTSTGSRVLTTTAADYDYVTITSPSCTDSPFILPEVISLRNGETRKVSLAVNLADAGIAQFYANADEAGGCKSQLNFRRVCAALPKMVPYLSDNTATVENYTLTTTDYDYGTTDVQKATLLVFIDSTTNKPLGATCRSKSDGTNKAWKACPADITSIAENADGKYTLRSFTDSTATTQMDISTIFERKSHTGTLYTPGWDKRGVTWTYTATKL
jgi:hypothetical protein